MNFDSIKDGWFSRLTSTHPFQNSDFCKLKEIASQIGVKIEKNDDSKKIEEKIFVVIKTKKLHELVGDKALPFIQSLIKLTKLYDKIFGSKIYTGEDVYRFCLQLISSGFYEEVLDSYFLSQLDTNQKNDVFTKALESISPKDLFEYLEETNPLFVPLLSCIAIENIDQYFELLKSIQDKQLLEEVVLNIFYRYDDSNLKIVIKLLDLVSEETQDFTAQRGLESIQEFQGSPNRNVLKDPKIALLFPFIKKKESMHEVLMKFASRRHSNGGFDGYSFDPILRFLSRVPDCWTEAKDSAYEYLFKSELFFYKTQQDGLSQLLDIANLVTDRTKQDSLFAQCRELYKSRVSYSWWLNYIDNIADALKLIRRIEDKEWQKIFFQDFLEQKRLFRKEKYIFVIAFFVYLLAEKQLPAQEIINRVYDPSLKEALQEEYEFIKRGKQNGLQIKEKGLFQVVIDLDLDRHAKSYLMASIRNGLNPLEYFSGPAAKLLMEVEWSLKNANSTKDVDKKNSLFNEIRGKNTVNDVDEALRIIMRIQDSKWKQLFFMDLLQQRRRFSPDQVDKIMVVFAYLVDNDHCSPKELIKVIVDPNLKKDLEHLYELVKGRDVSFKECLKLSKEAIDSTLDHFLQSQKTFDYPVNDEKNSDTLFLNIAEANKTASNIERKTIMDHVRGSDCDFYASWWLTTANSIDNALKVIEGIQDDEWKKRFLLDLVQKLFFHDQISEQEHDCLKTQQQQRKIFLVPKERLNDIFPLVKRMFGGYIQAKGLIDKVSDPLLKRTLIKMNAIECAKSGRMPFRACGEMSKEEVDQIINLFLKSNKLSEDKFEAVRSYNDLIGASEESIKHYVSYVIKTALYHYNKWMFCTNFLKNIDENLKEFVIQLITFFMSKGFSLNESLIDARRVIENKNSELWKKLKLNEIKLLNLSEREKNVLMENQTFDNGPLKDLAFRHYTEMKKNTWKNGFFLGEIVQHIVENFYGSEGPNEEWTNSSILLQIEYTTKNSRLKIQETISQITSDPPNFGETIISSCCTLNLDPVYIEIFNNKLKSGNRYVEGSWFVWNGDDPTDFRLSVRGKFSDRKIDGTKTVEEIEQEFSIALSKKLCIND